MELTFFMVMCRHSQPLFKVRERDPGANFNDFMTAFFYAVTILKTLFKHFYHWNYHHLYKHLNKKRTGRAPALDLIEGERLLVHELHLGDIINQSWQTTKGVQGTLSDSKAKHLTLMKTITKSRPRLLCLISTLKFILANSCPSTP